MIDSRPDWTALSPADKIEAIRPMVLAGKTSRQIAAMFVNCSRNSIISVCSRQRGDVKLMTKGGPIDRNGVPLPKRVKKPRAVLPKAATRPFIANGQRRPPTPPASEPFDMEDGEGNDVTHHVGLMELERSTCRWPVGPATGAAQLFCGSHTDHGPYCVDHAKRSAFGFGRGARP